MLNPAQHALLHVSSFDGGEGCPEWLTSVLAEMTTTQGRWHLALLILLITAVFLTSLLSTTCTAVDTARTTDRAIRPGAPPPTPFSPLSLS